MVIATGMIGDSPRWQIFSYVFLIIVPIVVYVIVTVTLDQRTQEAQRRVDDATLDLVDGCYRDRNAFCDYLLLEMAHGCQIKKTAICDHERFSSYLVQQNLINVESGDLKTIQQGWSELSSIVFGVIDACYKMPSYQYECDTAIDSIRDFCELKQIDRGFCNDSRLYSYFR